jgi:hypothetical protein
MPFNECYAVILSGDPVRIDKDFILVLVFLRQTA